MQSEILINCIQNSIGRAGADGKGWLILGPFDGTSKSSTERMSHEAFCVASKEGFRYKYDNHKQNEWLLQKLSALSSITQQGNDPDAMLGCDEVLMVRLLLEEQLLDGGRSNGRGGKYGGKFHPSTTSPSSLSSSADGQGKSFVGSRPLTVGELYANWSELRDVTRMKYPVIDKDSNGKAKQLDPLPYIRQYLREMASTPHDERHAWQPLAWDLLFGCQSGFDNGNGGNMELRQNTILLLGHDTQICLTLNSLSLLGCELDIETDLINRDKGSESMMLERLSSNHDDSKARAKIKVVVTTSSKVQERLGQGLLLVVPDAKTGETHSKMIERIVFDMNERPQRMKNIYLIHSSLEVLKQCKPFLGEDAPILYQGLRKCVLPRANDISMTLFLPEWAENVHISQKIDGEMDPWMNLLSEEQLLELISARTLAA